jgi:hypothetical protein
LSLLPSKSKVEESDFALGASSNTRLANDALRDVKIAREGLIHSRAGGSVVMLYRL